MKHSCLNFFYEIVNRINIKIKRNWNLKNLPRHKYDQFILNPDFKKIVTFMKLDPGLREILLRQKKTFTINFFQK